jgi:hypothetical protein
MFNSTPIPGQLASAYAKGGFLTAYRWSGEKALSPSNIIYAAAG